MPLIRKPPDRKTTDQSSAQDAPHVDVLKVLVTGTQEERWSAARAAADVPGGVDALAVALASEADPRVREAMFTSLTRVRSPDAINAIARLVRSDDASLRTGALDALRSLPQMVGDYLTVLMNDADVDVRLLSCEVVRGLPSEDATRMLCDLLKSETEVNVCAAAIDVLAEVGNSTALPVLAQCEARFRSAPFLTFAIKIAHDRIREQSTRSHV